MALETATIEIPMRGSLTQELDQRVVTLGSWLALDDVTVDKVGVWLKRPGFLFLGYPTNISPGGTVVPRYLEALFPQVDGPRLQTPFAVGAVGPLLYSSWLEQGDDPRPPFVATWTDETFGWEAKDTRPPFTLTRACEVRSSHELVAGACVVLDDVLWSAYKTSDPETPRVYLRGTSLLTGDVVQDDVYFFSLCGPDEPFALVAAGGLVVAVYVQETDPEPLYAYAQARFTPSTRAIVRDSFIEAAPESLGFCLFSVCNHPTDASVYLLALSVAEATNIQVSKRTPTVPGVPVTSALYDSGELVALAICALDTSALPAGSCWVSFSVTDGATRVVGFKDPAFTLAWSATTIDANAWTRIDCVATRNASGGFDQVHTSGVVPGIGGDFDRLWYRPVTAGAGNLVQARHFVAAAGCTPAARAFTWRGKAYLPVVVREPGEGGYANMHGAIYHLAETNGFEPWRAPLVGAWAVGRYALSGRFGGSVLNPPALVADEPEPSWVLHAPSRAGLSQTQIDRVTIDAPPENAAALPATIAQGLAYFPGALTTCFDGQRCVEAGFLARPFLGDPDAAPSGSGLGPGTYLWVFEWEWFDARGNRHTSPISPVLSFEVAETSDLTFGILTETYTRRADVTDTRDNAVRLVAYRTQKDSAGPFYRMTTPVALTFETGIGAPFAPLANDATVDTIVFTDDLADSDLVALGYGLYTGNLAGAIPGAIQDPGPVPPSRFLLNHKQRLFGISGDDPRTIFYSRFFVSGEAPAFPPAFVVYLSDTDEAATALAALQDKVLVFTANRIYYFYGEGPDDAGGGARFSEPTMCADTLGCVEPRSVAATPIGVVFQGSDDGLYLIDGGLSPVRISGAVEDYLRRAKVRSVHVDTARGTIVWTCLEANGSSTRSMQLVFHFWSQTWTRWLHDKTATKGNAGGCLWQGKHVHAVQYEAADSAYGMVAVESLLGHDRTRNAQVVTSYEEAFNDVRPVIRTPWIRLAGLTGFQRVRRFSIKGYVRSAIGLENEVQVELHHDDEDEGTPQTFTYDLATIVGLPQVSLEGHIARQKCSSVRATITLNDVGSGGGTRLTAFALELGGLRGFSKVAKANKGASSGGS